MKEPTTGAIQQSHFLLLMWMTEYVSKLTLKRNGASMGSSRLQIQHHVHLLWNAWRRNRQTEPQAIADCQQRTWWDSTSSDAPHSRCRRTCWFWIRDCCCDSHTLSQSDTLWMCCETCCQVDSLVSWKGRQMGRNKLPFPFHQGVVVHPLPCTLEMCFFYAMYICVADLLVIKNFILKIKKEEDW